MTVTWRAGGRRERDRERDRERERDMVHDVTQRLKGEQWWLQPNFKLLT